MHTFARRLAEEALPGNKRNLLAQGLWDSLTPEEVDAELPLTAEQIAELDRRLADLDEHPEAGVPWEQVRAELETELAATRHGRRSA